MQECLLSPHAEGEESLYLLALFFLVRYPYKLFPAIQLYCSRLSVVLLLLIDSSNTTGSQFFGRVNIGGGISPLSVKFPEPPGTILVVRRFYLPYTY